MINSRHCFVGLALSYLLGFAACSDTNSNGTESTWTTPVILENVGDGVPQQSTESPVHYSIDSLKTIKAPHTRDTVIEKNGLASRTTSTSCNGDDLMKDSAGQWYLNFPIGQEHEMVDFIGGTQQLYCARTIFRDKKDRIWFGSIGGASVLYKYDSLRYKLSYLTESEGLGYNVINAITSDLVENIWLGTGNGMISIYNGIEFVNFKQSDAAIVCMMADHYGQVWVGGFDGLRKYNKTKDSCTWFTDKSGLCNNSIQCLFEDSQGRIWIGTSDGISCYHGNLDSDRFTKITDAEGLPCGEINSIYEDDFKNIWFGTNGGGALCYDGQSWIIISRLQGLPNDTVKSINGVKGLNILFGTSNAISKIHIGRITDVVRDLNVTEMKEPLFQVLNDNLCSLYRNSICVDDKGHTWWSTKKGILYVE